MNLVRTDDIAWLAGLLEGEGYFCLGAPKPKRKRRIFIAIRMTDKDVIEKVCCIFECNIQSKTRTFGISKGVWCAELYGKRAIELMKLIHPYMGQRRKSRIDEILDYFNNYHRKESANARKIS